MLCFGNAVIRLEIKVSAYSTWGGLCYTQYVDESSFVIKRQYANLLHAHLGKNVNVYIIHVYINFKTVSCTNLLKTY